MKNRRLGVALSLALMVSITLTFLLYARIKRQYSQNTRPIKVLTAAHPVEPGTLLTSADVTLTDWPRSVPLYGAISNAENAVGRIALFPIASQEPVREALLAPAGATVGLTAKIPDGMRAVAIQTNEVNNVSGFLFPGCHVDALVTFRPSMNAKDTLTATVLQNVEVLSTGEKLEPDPSGKPQNVKQVTVLLNPEDAEKLVLASNQGTVQFVLRNSSDQAQQQHRSVALADLQGNSPVTAVTASRRPGENAKVANAYEVETYDGTKKGVVKF